MKRYRLVLFFVLSLALIGASYVFGSRADPPDRISIPVDGAGGPVSMKTTGELIAFWRGRFERDPRDYISLTYLGQAYLNQARETGDPNAYARAEAALRQALALNPDFEPALAFLGAVLFAQHDFQGALELASRVYAFDPQALHALATSGDAHLELGHYAEAETAYRQLLERSPSPPVYSRLARLAWLQGRPDEAIALMRQAAAEAVAAGQVGERAAWYQVQLGELYFNGGQLDAAGEHYAAALDLFDNYYLALAGLGKVSAARGNLAEAIARYEQATAIIPQPDLLAALGDLYALAGRPAEAQRQYATVEYTGKLAKINRQIYNRQLANFYADHDLHLEEALSLATAELEVRRDIYGLDAAAWAAYKNGLFDQARELSDQALRLGARDARLFYHAGLIARAQGRTMDAERLLAEALAINPHFDPLQAGLARSTLDQLRKQ